MHAGAYGLSLLSDPLDAQVLRALEGGKLSLRDLRRLADQPPQTTLRKHLKGLTNSGLLVRTQPREFPAAVTYELSASGVKLRATAQLVERWLEFSPSGPLPVERPATKRAIKSLVDAWTTRMLRVLAVKPLSLTELDRLLTGVDYPALERRLSAMRLAGQIEATSSHGGGTPYRLTRWLREAVGPLAAAAHWESVHGPADCEPLSRLDVEALFLMVMPLVRLPSGMSGSCRLIVDLLDEPRDATVDVTVVFEEGRPVSCVSKARCEPSSTASGTGPAWLAALSCTEKATLYVNGDKSLGEELVDALRRVCLRELPNRLPTVRA
jgi:DNA-binding HxlR family transcriptional regulator